jgi:hypothetical protein
LFQKGTVENIFDQVLKIKNMKLFLNLIPALAYALVTFFSNMTGLTSESSKTQEKKQTISQPTLEKESVCRNNYIWDPNNLQRIASSEDVNTILARKIPSPDNGMDLRTSLLIKRFILSTYPSN